MPDRLSGLDVSYLAEESAATPVHVGSVLVLQPDRGFDHDDLVAAVEQRIALVPRFRQRLRGVPGRLANPVWADDDAFDLAYHVRRSALPRPGTHEQLCELVGRLMGRTLDRSRPLWEVYLVEGLEGGRVAVVTKTHAALVDGAGAVDLTTVLLDADPEARPAPVDAWQPGASPSAVGLLAGAVAELARRPTAVVDTARGAVSDVRATAGRVAGAAGSVAGGLVGGLVSGVLSGPAPRTPLDVEHSEQRRFATARARLEDLRAVRAAHGGTVNDVVLAVVAGALRSWLLTRGEPVRPSSVVRATVPVSVKADRARGETGNRVGTYEVDLPVGEGNPAVRLSQVSFAMRKHHESGESVAAGALLQLAGFAPPTLTALGARAAAGLPRRRSSLLVTNTPGPQFPLYAAGARMVEVFPVVPLSKGQAVSIGVTSYDGGVFFGVNADRASMRDVAVLASCLEESLAELVGYGA